MSRIASGAELLEKIRRRAIHTRGHAARVRVKNQALALTLEKANKQRKLVQTPDYITYITLGTFRTPNTLIGNWWEEVYD